jgi:3-phosphoshikimate 1-carboxyvinyltransferase
LALLCGNQVAFIGTEKLFSRPLGVYEQLCREQGFSFERTNTGLTVQGNLKGDTFRLPGDVSSQFITGLLFALPMLEKNSQIRLTTDIESKGYVDMTLRTLEKFGIKVEEIENGYQVYGGQEYHTPRMVAVEGDWSNAAFWLAAGAMQGKIACQGLDVASAQGDKAIMEILERFGAEIKVVMNQVTAIKKELKGIRIDASQIPDLVPALCVVAAAAEGKTEIFHAGRLRLKESDRLAVMTDCLKKIGVEVEEHPEGLTIIGGCTPPAQAVTIDAHGDHRIVMAMAIAATSLGVEIIIEGADAVQKSYPSFFAEFTKLGGVADVL